MKKIMSVTTIAILTSAYAMRGDSTQTFVNNTKNLTVQFSILYYNNQPKRRDPRACMTAGQAKVEPGQSKSIKDSGCCMHRIDIRDASKNQFLKLEPNGKKDAKIEVQCSGDATWTLSGPVDKIHEKGHTYEIYHLQSSQISTVTLFKKKQ